MSGDHGDSGDNGDGEGGRELWCALFQENVAPSTTTPHRLLSLLLNS